MKRHKHPKGSTEYHAYEALYISPAHHHKHTRKNMMRSMILKEVLCVAIFVKTVAAAEIYYYLVRRIVFDTL